MRLFLAVPFLFGLIGGAPVGHAAAASFDCSKAQSPLEHAICDHPNLSRADETMSTAYATALGGLSAAADAALRESQKAWLSFVDRACTPDGLPAHQPYGDTDAACLVSEFQSRELLLEQSRMLGGLRFTFVDHDEAAFDSKTSGVDAAFRGVATDEASSSQIDATDDEATKFNAVVRSGLHSSGNTPPNGRDTSENLWVSTVDPTRITLTESDDEMNHGAAHDYGQITYLHFLRGPQRLLTAADVFGKSGWQNRLRRQVSSALKRSAGDALDSDAETQTAIRNDSVDPARWDFRPQGLLVQFGEGEIASPSQGDVSVIIPWALVEGDLTPDIGTTLRDGD